MFSKDELVILINMLECEIIDINEILNTTYCSLLVRNLHRNRINEYVNILIKLKLELDKKSTDE